ncbi:redox-sensing transcriptional repressor Rex [Quadrisphaera oryzae]|uniref:redox-sensing transcriptional repressor Rex n=1 Tax=Quadrisphaera TaxID=317661 RepID=UPI00351C69F7
MTDPHATPPLRAPRDGARGVPDATVARLPVYLRVLTGLGERGVATVSSEELALAAGVGSATLRKDLSHLGSYGVRGVGYEVARLVQHVGRCLGLAEEWRVVIVGIGSLGRALANYSGFAPLGTRVVALVDSDPAVVGERVAGLEVLPSSSTARVVGELGVRIAVLAVPAGAAQAACDAVVAAGITSVLSFAPVELQVPAGVELRSVDLSTELGILAFRERRRAATAGELPGELAGSAPRTGSSAGGAR